MKGVGLRLASYEFLEFIKIIKSSWWPVGRWNSSRRQGGSRTEKGQGGEGAGRDKRFGVRSRLRVDKRGKERESEWKWKEYAVTGSLWLRCLVYHNTRPSVRGTRTGGCTGTLLETVAMYQRTVKTPSWTAADPVHSKDCAANARDILSSLLSPLSVCRGLCYEVVPVVLLHDVERTIARICWKLCMDVGYDGG